MGMKIEVEAKIIYTVHLDNEDMAKIKNYLIEHEDELPSFKMSDNIAWAAARLFEDDEIDFYESGKADESDFYTEIVRWSEFEHRNPEDILESIT